jgi:uncharacterized protein DUF2795
MDINPRMNSAYVDSLLNGVALPATKSELIAYARRQEGGEAVAERLRALPEREFRTLDEVGEELEPRRPRAWRQPPPTELPKPESGLPPGGSAYLGEEQEPANVVAARSA